MSTPGTTSPPTGSALVLGAIAAIPVALALTSAFPVGARPSVFVAGLVVVAALGLAGGLRARAALSRGVSHTVRTGVLAIVGLTVGAVAAITCVAALTSAVF